MYCSTLSQAPYMISAHPSVLDISKSVSMDENTLSKLWLRASSHLPPCSAQSAASFMRGSQYWLHSHAAAHSLRQDWHAPDCSSSQLSLQKKGCFSQFVLQRSSSSADTPSGQKASLQLSPADTITPLALTVVPPQGITSMRDMACMYCRPRSSAAVMLARYSALSRPSQTEGSSAAEVSGLGQSHSGGPSGSSGSFVGSQRPTQIGVSTDALAQALELLGQFAQPSSCHTELFS
mmetsp:Transcript_77504/g.185834  ORF Transcript_77504/g.185834 Transcript_77504/m.185834 type:complete len:235 (-) Transcript_77504:1499-2203(-)